MKSEAKTIKVDATSTTFTQAESFRIISEAEHDCPAVVRVEAKADSTIATCDDGETYRVLKLKEPKVVEVAMKCSAMAGMGIEGGC